jgi:hypothetical protein
MDSGLAGLEQTPMDTGEGRPSARGKVVGFDNENPPSKSAGQLFFASASEPDVVAHKRVADATAIVLTDPSFGRDDKG